MKILKQYQNIVNQIIKHFFIEHINNEFLKEMSIYALTGGKRLRSSICLDQYLASNQQIRKTHQKQYPSNNDTVLNNNLSKLLNDKILSENICKLVVITELLHNVSLILDDLPSMDNDKMRRGQLTVHAKYNRSNAMMLASFFLEQCLLLLSQCFQPNTKMDFIMSHLCYFQDVLFKEMMISTEGQHLDLSPQSVDQKDRKYWNYYGSNDINNDISPNDINLNLIKMKTAPFFVTGFCAGYISSRVEYAEHQYTKRNIDRTGVLKIMDRSKARFDKLREAADQFSLGFQISDDILDVEKDTEKMGMDGLTANYAITMGIKKAKKQMWSSLNTWKNSLMEMSIWTDLMQELFDYLPKRKK